MYWFCIILIKLIKIIRVILIDVNDKIMFFFYSIDSDFFDILRNYFEKGIEIDVTVVKVGDLNFLEF